MRQRPKDVFASTDDPSEISISSTRGVIADSEIRELDQQQGGFQTTESGWHRCEGKIEGDRQILKINEKLVRSIDVGRYKLNTTKARSFSLIQPRMFSVQLIEPGKNLPVTGSWVKTIVEGESGNKLHFGFAFESIVITNSRDD